MIRHRRKRSIAQGGKPCGARREAGGVTTRGARAREASPHRRLARWRGGPSTGRGPKGAEGAPEAGERGGAGPAEGAGAVRRTRPRTHLAGAEHSSHWSGRFSRGGSGQRWQRAGRLPPLCHRFAATPRRSEARLGRKPFMRGFDSNDDSTPTSVRRRRHAARKAPGRGIGLLSVRQSPRPKLVEFLPPFCARFECSLRPLRTFFRHPFSLLSLFLPFLSLPLFLSLSCSVAVALNHNSGSGA